MGRRNGSGAAGCCAISTYRCRDGSRHDCVIAVCGGKDSYFQTHVIKHEFGINPLLVTYNGNNWTPSAGATCTA